MSSPVESSSEERKQSGVEREYRTEQIVVYWEPALCVHTARCLNALPQVFDVNRRPWVDVHAASADEIARVVALCPTSALRYERLDGASQEEAPEVTTIQARPNGPLYVRGNLQIVDQDGSVRQLNRAVLCRCGLSGNRPFCDNTHRKAGFKTTD